MQVTSQVFKDNYFKLFTFLQKMKRAWAKNIYLKLAPNVRVLAEVREK
jgi:hypothetical protein